MKRIFNIVVGIVTLTFLAACNSSTGLGLNEQASVKTNDKLPENPLLLHIITSSICPKDSTMASLYGNDTAFIYATHHKGREYPAGSILYEVTWRQQADEQWVGANIPKEIFSIERLEYTATGRAIYTIYKGSPLKKVMAKNTLKRVAAISKQRMAVSP
ncbi:MAG TPA: hypothetical protein VN040_19260 [Pseudosphingobacterium sp.]|nr:hypothetical protein [Pseudosphingobacterium sp.]